MTPIFELPVNYLQTIVVSGVAHVVKMDTYMMHTPSRLRIVGKLYYVKHTRVYTH